MLNSTPASRITLAVLVAAVAGLSGYVIHDRLSPTQLMPDAKAAASPAPLAAPQVDQLTAPVALYPDGLLVQVLEASKHPDDVMAAAAWAKQHAGLSGQAAIAAVSSMPWDASVKSLVAFPQALLTLAADPKWMRGIGQEFAANPRNVMQSTQRLRKMASSANSLRSDKQQTVVVTGNVIQIQPADPKVIYVPTYNPALVYGAWPYQAYPPVYAPVAAGFVVGMGVGVVFGTGVALSTPLWSSVNWNTASISVNYSEVNISSSTGDLHVNYNESSIDHTSVELNETHVREGEVGQSPQSADDHSSVPDETVAAPQEPTQPEDTHAPHAAAEHHEQVELEENPRAPVESQDDHAHHEQREPEDVSHESHARHHAVERTHPNGNDQEYEESRSQSQGHEEAVYAQPQHEFTHENPVDSQPQHETTHEDQGGGEE